MTEVDVSVDFTSVEMLPERTFFSKTFISQYKHQMNELIKQMERLVEEKDNLETESNAIERNGAQLVVLNSDVVWHNLCALQDCNSILGSTVELFKQKIQESVGLVAADPEMFELERTQSSSSMLTSEYSSDGVEETDEEVEGGGFQDVEPVKGRKAAVALNNDVTERVQSALDDDEEEFERFKAHALEFGLEHESAEEFYGYFIREFNKETFMDVLYYLSPRYGQLIVDSVTQQLNDKYRVFMDEHPGWDGKVSIFAHSLGSMIAYDILTHKPDEIASNGVRFPGLDFEIDNFFGVGSPVGVMILARGDLNINDGEFTPGIKIPNCRRYYNVYHPIDPIAYRIEPLIKQEMHDKEPVQLMQVLNASQCGTLPT
ncbi:hypothetical protein BBJ29_006418 [Phytophthora kernoviae]|uniref:DDHD domain-containing protein n=1 Tax=Phytophthora kernoviae TaxID=325452 RepID=A0A421FY22_9STRA|nr:hypothetical protein BBJ29_006418 [Phytophthora kernoviae]